MPIDYNSFMAGLQVGLRLQRPPEGRKPPAPSGRYILTESGEKVLTELRGTNVTFAATEAWNELDENWVLYFNTKKARLRVSDGKQIQFFGATRYSDYWYVLVSEESFVGKTIYYDLMRNDDTIRTRSEGPINDGYFPSTGGALYLLMFGLNNQAEPRLSFLPNGYISWHYPEQIQNIVANLKSLPLITE